MVVSGHGQLLDPNRVLVAEGDFRLPSDSVALYETNVLRPSGGVAALTVMSGITAVVAGICIASPKTCFGSCPTFYADGAAGPVLQAEGFSGSIAPALEATDVDALYRARIRGRDFRLHLTNEAMETHVVRYANLLVAPRPPGGRVFVTASGEFRQGSDPLAPARCDAAEGDCRDAVREFDGVERFSPADSTDLAAREAIDLEFPAPPPGDVGVVISARQSLLSTFLLYQSLAYFGSSAARWLAALDPGPGGASGRTRVKEMGRLLGTIEVLAPDSVGGWTPIGSAGETGPLAADTKVIPVPPQTGPIRLRLRLTRGMWRLDRVGLTTLGPKVTPLRLPPARVRREGRADPVALAALTDSARTLVTFPGDAYDLNYRVPQHPERYELFLESRGYYLEWMRREWLAEENPVLAARVMLDPAGMLRTLAPAYKAQEAMMETVFWQSRYAPHQ